MGPTGAIFGPTIGGSLWGLSVPELGRAGAETPAAISQDT